MHCMLLDSLQNVCEKESLKYVSFALLQGSICELCEGIVVVPVKAKTSEPR